MAREGDPLADPVILPSSAVQSVNVFRAGEVVRLQTKIARIHRDIEHHREMARPVKCFVIAASLAALASACAPAARQPRPVVVPQATPAATPPTDPVEVARRKSLYLIAVMEMGRPTDPAHLSAWLKDANPSVRAAGATALGRAGEALAFAGGDPTAFVDALLAHTSDPAVEVRLAIASAVGLIGEKASGRITAPFEAEKNADVRAKWIRAAGRVAPLPKPAAAETTPTPTSTPETPASNADPVSSPELLLLEKALADEDLAPDAGLALGVWGLRCERGGAGIPALSKSLAAAIRERFNGTAGRSRLPYAYAIWRLRQTTMTSEARDGLADPDARVRGVSARALGGIPGAHGRREVSRLLRDSNPATRVEAARALAKLADADSTAAVDLVELLELSDPPKIPDSVFPAASTHVAIAAAEALGDLKFRATAEPLRARLGSEDPYLFAAVSVAYVKVVGLASIPDFAQLLAELQEPSGWRHRKLIAEALAGLPKEEAAADRVPFEAAPLFDRLLADADLRVRASALDAYAELAGPAARPQLLEALKSDDVAMIGVGAGRLEGFAHAKDAAASAEDGPALVTCLARLVESAPDTAAGVVSAAAMLGGDAAIPVLEKAAVSKSNALMLAAAKALRAKGRTPPARTEPPSALPSEADWLAVADHTRMTVRTTRGDVRVALRADIAPTTVLHLVTLSRKGYFDDIIFHRVVPAFVVQGGDPRGDGNGGPGSTIPCELSDLPYEVGTVGMALSGRDTGGSQFFIATTPQPHLEGNYTVFGKVTDGMYPVVDQLEVGDRILELSFP